MMAKTRSASQIKCDANEVLEMEIFPFYRDDRRLMETDGFNATTVAVCCDPLVAQVFAELVARHNKSVRAKMRRRKKVKAGD